MINFLIAPDYAPERFAGWHMLNIYLQKMTDTAIHLIMPDGYSEQMEALNKEKVGLVYANPFDASHLVRDKGYLALARPRGVSDEMLIATYNGSPYSHSDELKPGSKILITENYDVQLIGLRLLESAGLTENDIEWIRADTFQEVARRLINKEADAAFFLNSTYNNLSKSTHAQMKVLMQSHIYDLFHVFLLHSDYAEVHEFFSQIFTQMDTTPEGRDVLQDLHLSGFDALSQENVEFIIDLIETLKD